MKNNPIKNNRGQIAIFVVLVFQVLFVLFAMTINIGLMIHDKINFQNSLDLAAYYGAKKQAEVLNVMAHINYQMRQNWKLLAWRYRILGTLGQRGGWHKQRGPGGPFWCPQNTTSTISCVHPPLTPPSGNHPTNSVRQQWCSSSLYPNGYCDDKYAICISEHNLWSRGISFNNGDELCSLEDVNIPPIQIPRKIDGPLSGLAGIAVGGVTSLIDEVTTASCPIEGVINFLIASLFVGHFRLDQADRKAMIQSIYENTLQQGKDLEGKNILKGATKVFKHNLTKNNKESIPPGEFQRSLMLNLPGKGSFEGVPFEEVFKQFYVFPVLFFKDFENGGSNCNFNNKGSTIKQDDVINAFNTVGSNKLPSIRRNLNSPFTKTVLSLNHQRGPNVETDTSLRSLTLGFYKKDDNDKNLYFALKGELTYQPRVFSLPVSPPIKFKGNAFAKPFGGRFGPGPAQQDKLIPAKNSTERPLPPLDGVAGAQAQSATINLQPNYSRWPGDKWGLIDFKLHNQWPLGSETTQFLTKFGQVLDNSPFTTHNQPYPFKKIYTIDAFFHIFLSHPSNQAIDDPLARPPSQSGDIAFSFMRMMELMAVYPDVFDVSNYSILGNYMETYFPLVCKLLNGSECSTTKRNKNNKFSGNNPRYIRGDFGWPFYDSHYKIKNNQTPEALSLSIAPYFLKKQGSPDEVNDSTIDMSPVPPPPGGSVSSLPDPKFISNNNNPNYPGLSSGKLFYDWIVKKLPGELLSSWTPNINPDRYKKYTMDNSQFLKCHSHAPPDMPSPSACAIGGRSGYSVKLISCNQIDSPPTGFFCP